MNSALTKYDAACRAIAAAKCVDEVKDLHDQSFAMQAYARQAKNRQLEVDAAEIRMRAERRLGELIVAQKETVGLNTGTAGLGRPTLGGTKMEPPKNALPTLAEAGIDKKLSSRAQKMAAVPEQEFEGMLGEWRERVHDENERVTTNILLRGEREMKRSSIIDRLESIEAKEAKELAGEYDVIVIDPPWPMEKIERDVRPNQSHFDYPVMSEEELSRLLIPTAKDCHIWLWTTHKFLPMAMRLLDGWEFNYVCTFTWHKPGGFQPFGLPQYNCEFALYARKGTPQFVDTKAFPVCFNAPRGAHSEKPEEFYEVVRRVTAGRRLDMFNRRLITGFDGWGKESAA
jgi:N6-adenosine-specific RNA methylase IME4